MRDPAKIMQNQNEGTQTAATAAAEIRAQLVRQIEARTARIAVIGLGYVGLPLAVEFAHAGFAVAGVDIDEQKIRTINEGGSYVRDVKAEAVAEMLAGGRLQATSDYSCLADADIIIVCVPTPLRKTKDPDISYILDAAGQIREHLRPGRLIVLESTTYPGTTDEVLLPLFEQGGLQLDRDFLLAFSPERVDPGNPKFNTRNIPKLIGGVSAASGEVAALAYSQIVAEVHLVSSARVAETAKLLENTFRSVNIALVNEIAQLCHALQVDVWEVIEAAATKPFGFMPFFPGPGIGGHCIPLDPQYLFWKGRMHGFEARFIGLADVTNSAMPAYVVSLISDALNGQHKCVKGASILLLGIAYKRDVGDVRESPALEIIDLLERKGARVTYCDPHVPSLQLGKELRTAQACDEQTIRAADCVVIVTNHSAFDYPLIVRSAQLVVDTRNATRKLGAGQAHVVKL